MSGQATEDKAVKDRGTTNRLSGPAAGPQQKKLPTYDRAAAVAYARAHYDQVCTDGYVALSRPKAQPKPITGSAPWYPVAAGTKFVLRTIGTGEDLPLPNNQPMIPWSDLDDCAHFVSCCIGSPPKGKGGGLKVSSPHAGPYGQIGIPGLVVFLRTQGQQLSAPKSTLPAALAPGDVLVYSAPKGKANLMSRIHCALYLGDAKIACHTWQRCDWRWDLYTKVEFFHITVY